MYDVDVCVHQLVLQFMLRNIFYWFCSINLTMFFHKLKAHVYFSGQCQVLKDKDCKTIVYKPDRRFHSVCTAF